MPRDPSGSAAVDREDLYCDRVRHPADTVAALRPHFETLGITCIARQTGLDRIGIPCFAAFRPNAQSLAANQGKGLTDDAARASAVMEALEFAIAEQPLVPVRRAKAGDLARQGWAILDPARWLPFGTTLPEEQDLDWIEGYTLRTSAPVAAPADLVRMGTQFPDLEGVSRNTNGLASGNDRAEAVFHALCELIERDGTTLWSLLSADERRSTAVRIETFDDLMVAELVRQIFEAGFDLRLFDQSSDLGIPVVMAVLGPRSREGVRHFDVSAGYGAHPVAARAALRAITEAAQTRITVTAGSRDDIDPIAFEERLEVEVSTLLGVTPVRAAPKGMPLGTPLALLQARIDAALDSAGVEAAVFPLGGEAFGASVVKVLSTTLEDREPNPNWRPGARALSIILSRQ